MIECRVGTIFFLNASGNMAIEIVRGLKLFCVLERRPWQLMESTVYSTLQYPCDLTAYP
jgi:hypothetical protein